MRVKSTQSSHCIRSHPISPRLRLPKKQKHETEKKKKIRKKQPRHATEELQPQPRDTLCLPTPCTRVSTYLFFIVSIARMFPVGYHESQRQSQGQCLGWIEAYVDTRPTEKVPDRRLTIIIQMYCAHPSDVRRCLIPSVSSLLLPSPRGDHSRPSVACSDGKELQREREKMG